MIYLDNAATTKPTPEIIKLHQRISEEYWYNTNSIHTLGIKANTLLEQSINVVKDSLKVKNKKVIYTSSATSSNNLAIYGICNAFLGQNKHIITSKIEHPSVLNCYKDLETKGFKVTYLSVDHNGIIDLNELKSSITSDTVLISIMWVNNIIGSIQPIKEVINIIKQYPRIKFHLDAVGGIGKLKNDFSFEDIDLITFTPHKLHGLKGTGLLVLNNNINLISNVKGGHQQYGFMPGTVDLPGVVCASKTIKEAILKIDENYQYVEKLYNYLIKNIQTFNNIIINSPNHNYSIYVLNISFKNVKGETVVHFLEKNDIFVSTTSACNSTVKNLDKTLMATFGDEQRTINAIRISLSKDNTKEEIDQFIKILKEVEKI